MASSPVGRKGFLVDLVGVDLGDGGDLVGPQSLRLKDLSLRHGRRLRRVGDRRMVKVNPDLAIGVA